MNAQERERILDGIDAEGEYWYPDPGGNCAKSKGTEKILVSLDGFFTVEQLRAIADYADEQQAEMKKKN